MMMFAIVVTRDECKNIHGYGSEKGDEYLILNGDEYVVANSTAYRENSILPIDTMIFKSKQEAELFIRKWKGYPWWVKPLKNKHKLIRVYNIYEPKLIGYKTKDKNAKENK